MSHAASRVARCRGRLYGGDAIAGTLSVLGIALLFLGVGAVVVLRRALSAEAAHKVAIVTLVVLPLLGIVAAVLLLWQRYVFLTDLLLLGVFYTVTIVGVGTGYHRMLTHRGFEGPAWLRAVLLIAGAMAFEGPPDTWAATHIKHHAHSDEEGDPHSPIHGFWHAHMGWLFSRRNFPEVKTYAPHLLEDPVVRFVSRWEPLWLLLALAIPFAIGGFTGLVWGGGVRIFLGTHITWSVNSICHTFGRRDFETTDESRNNWIIGLLGFGEGWHNNHHAFPQNAFHGLRWWQIDGNGLLIRALERLRLIWNVSRVSWETAEAQKERSWRSFAAISDLRQQVMHSIHVRRSELTASIDRVANEMGGEAIFEGMAICDDALMRLDQIRDTVERAQHLRKQRLETYRQEVEKLSLSCQTALRSRMGKISAQRA